MHRSRILPAVHTTHSVLLAVCYDPPHVRYFQTKRELGSTLRPQDQLFILQVQPVRVGHALPTGGSSYGPAVTPEIRQSAGCIHTDTNQLLVSRQTL